MPETDAVPMDLHLVAFDEKEHYNLDPKHAPYIKAIWDVYVYDKNRHVHLCELTPSYELYYLYTEVILTPEGYDLDDEQKDEMYQAYEYDTGNDPVTYTHVYSVDRLASEHPDQHAHYGPPEQLRFYDENDLADLGDQERYEKIMEWACDDLNANHEL